MVADIDRTELLDLIAADDLQLIDVLPVAEYESEHIPGALSIPLRSLDAESVAHLSKSKPTVVY